MDRTLLARVFTPLSNSDLGECGTGYLVRPDLLLTCWHAIHPDTPDPGKCIEVRWHNHPDAATRAKWFELGENPVVWKDKHLDAALLRCAPPAGLRGWAGFSETPPRTGDRWESAGFPRVAKYDDVQHEASFIGTAHAVSHGEPNMSLDLDVAPPIEGDWRGASGMPIFRLGSNVVIGILRQVPLGWGGHRAEATPSFRLLANAQFRAAVRQEGREARQGRYKKQLVAALRNSPRAMEEIRKAAQDDVEASLDSIAALLVDPLKPEQAATTLREAHDAVLAELDYGNTAELQTALETLQDAVEIVVPFHCDPADFEALRPHKLPGVGILQELPCALEMVAEIFMAGADDRRTQFRLREDDHDFPVGLRSMAQPPNAGIGGADRRREEMRQGLSGKFGVGGWEATRKHVDDVMIEHFVSTTGSAEMTYHQKVAAAAIQLEEVSRRGRYYLTCRLPKNGHARAEMESGLKTLMEHYPAIVILILAGDGARELEERRRYGTVQQMTRKK